MYYTVFETEFQLFCKIYSTFNKEVAQQKGEFGFQKSKFDLQKK